MLFKLFELVKAHLKSDFFPIYTNHFIQIGKNIRGFPELSRGGAFALFAPKTGKHTCSLSMELLPETITGITYMKYCRDLTN